MISFVLMAALSTAPEMQGHFKKRCNDCAPAPACSDCAAPAPACGGCAGPACSGCGAPGAPAPAPGTTPPGQTQPDKMPKGDTKKVETKVDDKTTKVEEKKVEVKKEAPIEIPAKLKEAIDKSEQKQQIMDYLNNTSVPRDKRIQYLETVRQTLLGDEKKKEEKK